MPRRGDVESSATLGAAAAAGWAYLAEGGAHLVLERRDVADDDPNVAGRVLRLRKTKTEPSSFGEDVARDDARDDALEPRSNALTDDSLWASHPGFENARSAEDRSWAFAHNVMRPLLGDRFVDPGAFAPVDHAFLRAVADAVEPARPRARCALSRIDPAATRAALAPDARRVDRVRVGAEDGGAAAGAAADWFSVEIKPKCGFALPGDPASTSRFAMHQALRVRSGEVRRVSAYDPLDLFAGCDDSRESTIRESTTRRVRALRALADAPRNNLRVARRGFSWPGFRDTTRLDSDSGESSESLDAFVSRTDGPATGQEAKRLGGAARLLDLVNDALAASGVLAALLRAQRRDTIGAETAAALYESLSSTSSDVVSDDLEKMRDFVVAAVAKDCSVLVAFRERERDDDDDAFDDDGTFAVAAAAEGGTLPRVRYRCRVSVVDVDLKPIANISKWLATHRRIARNWATEKRAARSDAQPPSDDDSM
jgi:inositol-pentakisphosphate 2-kinase